MSEGYVIQGCISKSRKDVRLGCMQVWSKRKRKKAEVVKGKERETKETCINKLSELQ